MRDAILYTDCLGICQAHLCEIAVLFHDIDWAIMREISLDRAYLLKENYSKLRARTLFDEKCHLLQPFEQAMNERTSHAHSIHDLEISSLVDTTFNNIRSLAATSLLEF